MKRTITINLGGQSFAIDEDAYHRLESYLSELRRRFNNENDTEEVLADIESGLADKLSSRLSGRHQNIILSEVEEALRSMGTPEDFDRELGDSPSPQRHLSSRRLYRDLDNRLLGGVASGLGAYFDIDPLIFRLLFFVSIFAGGFGFALYILLWLIVPAAKNAHQRLEMRGERPTAAAIERLAKKGYRLAGDWRQRWRQRSVFKKIISLPFMLLDFFLAAVRKICNFFGPIIRVAAGAFLSFFGLMFLGLVSIAAAYSLLEANSAYLFSYLPVKELTASLPFFWLVISGSLSFAIPSLFLFFFGLIIISKKNFLNLISVSVLLGICFVSLVAFVSLGLRYFPDVYHQIKEYPALQTVEKNLPLAVDDKIVIEGRYLDAVYHQSTTTAVILTGRQVDLDSVSIKESDGILNLSLEPTDTPYCLACDHRRVQVDIYQPAITSLLLDSSGLSGENLNLSIFEAKAKNGSRLDLSGSFNQAAFSLDSSDLDFSSATTSQLSLEIKDGYSRSRLSGQVNDFKFLSDPQAGDFLLDARRLNGDKSSLEASSGKILLGRFEAITAGLSSEALLYYDKKGKISGDYPAQTVKSLDKYQE
jgi:phage shock protein PspC (stress-responsive transcriptional regulator)